MTTDRVIERTTVFEGRKVRIDVLHVERPDSTTYMRETVVWPDSACIVPLFEDGVNDPDNPNRRFQVLLVRQWRAGSETNLWEIPAGMVEPGEDPIVTAARESEEETGWKPTLVKHLFSTYLTPGYCTEKMHTYVGEGWTATKMRLDDEERITSYSVPLEDIPGMIENGSIGDIKTVAALQAVLRMKGM